MGTKPEGAIVAELVQSFLVNAKELFDAVRWNPAGMACHDLYGLCAYPIYPYPASCQPLFC
jgi:hypothetical protein